ncbi:MAG TPA: EAL domain-containing protein [Bauldia sp.]|nr:EAL domain-containing protein [Bauldia sp.]
MAASLAASILACIAIALLAIDRQSALRRIRQSEQSFRDLYDNLREGVFRSTLGGRMISANPALVRLNGYESEAEMLAGVNDIATEWYVDPQRRAEIHDILLRQGKAEGIVSEVYRHKTRDRIWIEENTRLVRDRVTGAPLYYDGTVREVTETVRRLELQARYDKITSIMPVCLYQHRMGPDGTSQIPYASAGLKTILGIDPEDVVQDGSLLLKRIHPEDRERVMASFRHAIAAMSMRECEYRIITPDGIEKWVFGQSVPEREPDGSILWHGSISDITGRKRAEARVERLAYFDPLTDLPNRTSLMNRLAEMVAAVDDDSWSAVLFIDLDQFKQLNDTKGHETGDRMLRQVASRLSAVAAGKAFLARQGGDEFVMVLCRLGRDRGAAEAAAAAAGREIAAALVEPFVLDGISFQTTASVGVALFLPAGANIDDVLKRADLAMYEAKSLRGGGLAFFEPRMLEELESRVSLTNDLRRAIQEEQFDLLFQPQVDVYGHWVSAEALIRWHHPSRGYLAPDEFLGLAESTGLSSAIDAFVLRAAVGVLARWQADPVTAHLHLAVNITAAQLARRGFADNLVKTLDEAGAEPSRLTLELTEKVVLGDTETVLATMRELRAKGIRFSLDDFGTGYSSLAYLKNLPIDALKIDRTFVQDLEASANDQFIVQTIVSIARNLGVAVVAEGVETEVQRLLLWQFGCRLFQGYLYSRPLSAPEFEATLRRQAATSGTLTEKLRA